MQIYRNKLKKVFTQDKGSTPTGGLVWVPNMAPVLKFWYTNIADETSGETALQTGLPFPEKGELKQPTGFMRDPQKSRETIFN